MEQIILVVHLLLALAIIGLILLQQGKGAEVGASFGAGASQTLFGSDGSGNVLTRATAWMAALFFATSFGLALIATQKTTASNDLDLLIPDAVESAPREVEDVPPAPVSDLPQVDPVASPEASSNGTEEEPADADLPVGDIPQS